MIYFLSISGIILVIFSYLYLSSVAYHAAKTVTCDRYKYKKIKTVNAEEFLLIYRNANIDWIIDEKYRTSIFSKNHDNMIHVNALFMIHDICYIFDCAKSYNKVVKILRKEITIIHAKAYLTA